jgi:hypothetical protein
VDRVPERVFSSRAGGAMAEIGLLPFARIAGKRLVFPSSRQIASLQDGQILIDPRLCSDRKKVVQMISSISGFLANCF